MGAPRRSSETGWPRAAPAARLSSPPRSSAQRSALPLYPWRRDALRPQAHRGGGRGEPEAAEDGPYRPLSAPLAGPRHQRLRPVELIERSEEHTSELQSLMRISYAVFCLNKKKTQITNNETIEYRNLYTSNQNTNYTSTST